MSTVKWSMATQTKQRGHLKPIHSVLFDIKSGIYILYIKIKTIHLATCLTSYTSPVIIILVFDIHIYRYSNKTLLFKIIRVEWRWEEGEIQVSRRRVLLQAGSVCFFSFCRNNQVSFVILINKDNNNNNKTTTKKAVWLVEEWIQ